MEIIEPAKELRPYVRYYWILKSDNPLSVLTFPIGCPQIIFHRKNPLYIPEIKQKQSRVTISGQVNFPAHIQSDGDVEMIVAVFFPHTIGMFIDTPPSAFYNQEISGADIKNRALDETAEKIMANSSGYDCISIIEKWLLTKINPSLNLKRIGSSVGQIMHCPSLHIGSLADAACLSKKQYGRIFKEQVGMNPKEYARIVRFQKALWLLQCGKRNFAHIAAECGYADQSHLIREFRTMSGYTPKSILDHCKPYSDLFTNPLA